MVGFMLLDALCMRHAFMHHTLGRRQAYPYINVTTWVHSLIGFSDTIANAPPSQRLEY